MPPANAASARSHSARSNATHNSSSKKTSARLFPTPTQGNHRTSEKAKKRGCKSLKDVLLPNPQEKKLWPTTRAGNPGSRKPGTGGKVLAEEARKSLETYETLTENNLPESGWSQVDFLASHSARPGSDEARLMTVISGRKCCALFPKPGPLGSLVRMLLASSRWNSTVVFLTWRISATPSSRLLFRLAPWTPDTGETGFGFWLTPSQTNISERSDEAMERRTQWRMDSGRKTVQAGNLAEQVQFSDKKPCVNMLKPTLLPTPTHSTGGKEPKGKTGRKLVTAVANLLPTPTQRDFKDGTAASCKNVPVNGLLGRAVHTLENSASGSLNPQWVEWLMGYPAGWTDCAGLAMPSSRKSRRKSSAP